MSEPLLLPLAKVAELTGWPLRPLENDCRAGLIEHVHRGRERYMTPDQVDALIRAHTVKPKPSSTADAKDKVRARLAGRRNRRAA